ncbi:HD domain-containing protein [Peptoniphilus equinus]|uniref:HD domain-containing protein n=1 Tax=Peptoniphilus equinus TaxID=3016343 RepID=A0ABY7QTX1_9FIRM|nr:HD domain-containing protein [Peptoniphilus equinus]WBW50227.1 HD domain-containing protein [Peptoniphilus equinus]
MDQAANELRTRLINQGYPTYFVGGCVRDYLLGVTPHDYDLTTLARPEDIKAVFSEYRCIELGAQYGTIGVVVQGQVYEITTFRADLDYTDHRHPVVQFADTLESDLSRRDFTINAMAYGDTVVDLFGGQEDLKARRLRTVGNPVRRFEEDALRMVRAVRFATVLDFILDSTVIAAIRKCAELIEHVARERLRGELEKILLSPRVKRGFELFEETGLLRYIEPALARTVGYDQGNAHHAYSLFEHILRATEQVPRRLALRLAALYHDTGKVATWTFDGEKARYFHHEAVSQAIAKQSMKAFGFDKKTVETVLVLIGEHMKLQPVMSDKALRKQIRRVGIGRVDDLYALFRADRLATARDADISDIEANYRRIQQLKDEPITSDRFLAINGDDIKALGYEEGKEIGIILHHMEELVLENPKLNQRDTLIDCIKKYTKR